MFGFSPFNLDNIEEGTRSVPADEDPAMGTEGIPEGLLEVLGEKPIEGQDYHLSLVEDLATRWIDWRTNGVKLEELTESLAKYPRNLETCYMEAPLLNAEVKSILT